MKHNVRLLLMNVVVSILPWRLRPRLLRRCGMNVGSGTMILSRCLFSDNKVSFGRNCFVNTQVLFDASAPITIGDSVQLAYRVTLVTGTHKIGESTQRASSATCEPIVIGTGCWLGASTTVMPGVTIGQGCIVAAGSVVVDDCAPDGLYGGVPARRIRDL